MVSRRPPTPPNAALQFFTPGRESEEIVEEAEAISQRLALLTNTLAAETINLVDDNDDDIDGHPQDFMATQDSETGPKLGHDATGHSPPALINPAPVVRSPPHNPLPYAPPALLLLSLTPYQTWMAQSTLTPIFLKARIRMARARAPTSSQCL